MRYPLLVFSIMILAIACRPSLKIQKTQENISREDTATVAAADTTNADSLRLVKEVYNKVLTNKIDFNTFSAKVKVDYQTKDESDGVTAYIRIRKDSLIWLSLRGALGIEGARVLITKDSVTILNVLKKEVIRRSIDYLQQVAKLPFDFVTLQDLIIGNPVYVDSNITRYGTNAQNQFEVKMKGDVFEHVATLENNDFRILHSMLKDLSATSDRKSEISYAGYENTAGVPFAVKRSIAVADKSSLKTELEFKSYAFNQPVTFPFDISDDYKEIK